MRLKGLVLLLPLVLVVGGCSEEEGGEPEESGPNYPEARTEPAEFRQESLSETLSLAPPEGDLGENRAVTETPEGKPAAFGIPTRRCCAAIRRRTSGCGGCASCGPRPSTGWTRPKCRMWQDARRCPMPARGAGSPAYSGRPRKRKGSASTKDAVASPE